MGISELSPGFYKVKRRRDAVMSRRKGTFMMGSFHIMEVKGQGRSKTITIDNGPEYKITDFVQAESEDYEVIGRIGDFGEISRQLITISWQDEQGDEFQLRARDTWMLRNIFFKFKFLAKPFLFVPRKEREG
jgi:hypothetical protein